LNASVIGNLNDFYPGVTVLEGRGILPPINWLQIIPSPMLDLDRQRRDFSWSRELRDTSPDWRASMHRPRFGTHL